MEKFTVLFGCSSILLDIGKCPFFNEHTHFTKKINIVTEKEGVCFVSCPYCGEKGGEAESTIEAIQKWKDMEESVKVWEKLLGGKIKNSINIKN